MLDNEPEWIRQTRRYWHEQRRQQRIDLLIDGLLALVTLILGVVLIYLILR
jgi:hypothetical protein